MSIAPRVNWSLWMGLLITVAVLTLAAIGPSLVPLPTPNFFIILGTETYQPPFPPLTLPGYPLGSDALGRGVLNQLLWAIRPTMQVLGLMAFIRLALGAAIGLAAGWAEGERARVLDSIIAAALAPPVLVVALLIVAALGDKLGVRAFVLGLCVTGWAETARAVREQTRLIKSQSYIEAARAIGASDLFVVIQHVLRQILPLLSILAAFEVSGTLLTLGTLGFLGYYFGGNIWIDISDSTVLRASRVPELGQMLAGDSTEIFLGPWKMFAAGSVVVLIILGFNLLGSGLQRAMEQRHLSYTPSLSLLYYVGQAAFGLTWPIWVVLRRLPQPPPVVRRVLLALCLIALPLAGMKGWETYQARQAARSESPFVVSVLEEAAGLAVRGEHLWPSDLHDPFGTQWSAVRGPGSARVVWRFEVEQGFSGGPVVAADGTLYVAGLDGSLYALDGAGTVRWQQPLTARPSSTPALAPDGTLYVADEAGGLSAISQTGALLWHVEGNEDAALSAPIVAADGTLLYATEQAIRAVGAQGALLWESARQSGVAPDAPLITDPTSTWLFIGKQVLRTSDGQREARFNVQPSRYIIGANGTLYLQQTKNSLTRWEWTENGFLALRERTGWWERTSTNTGPPRRVGVAPDGHIWYQANVDNLFSLGWRTSDADASGLYTLPLLRTRLIGLDRTGTAFACGEQGRTRLVCVAVPPNATSERWHLDLPPSGQVMGGALAPARLYVTTAEGILYAIEGR